MASSATAFKPITMGNVITSAAYKVENKGQKSVDSEAT
jgi:hypothetical protein